MDQQHALDPAMGRPGIRAGDTSLPTLTGHGRPLVAMRCQRFVADAPEATEDAGAFSHTFDTAHQESFCAMIGRVPPDADAQQVAEAGGDGHGLSHAQQVLGGNPRRESRAPRIQLRLIRSRPPHLARPELLARYDACLAPERR